MRNSSNGSESMRTPSGVRRFWLGRSLRTPGRLYRRIRTRRKLERELPRGAHLLVVPLVRFDNALHQVVPHHVAFIEVHKADARYALKHFERIQQAAALTARKVDLSDVAVHYHLGIEALARQHHFHLLGGAVLGLIQDDEAVVERAAAHEGNGRHFDGQALEQFFHLVWFEHIVKGVIKRAQVRIHLLLQGSWEKAQALAGLYRRPRQNDAAHALTGEGPDRHGHRQIGFPGSRGSHAEHQVVAFDRFQIAALIDGLGRNHFLAKTALPATRHQRAQGHIGIFGDHSEVTVQIPVVKRVPLAHQSRVVLQDAFGSADVGGLTLDLETVIDELSADLEAVLDQTDVLVAGSKKAFNSSDDLYACFHL